jgi:hypothetical protein
MRIAAALARLLQHIHFMETLQTEAETARLALKTAQAELEAAQRGREEAVDELFSLEARYRTEHAQLESLSALIKDRDEAGQAAEKNGAQANDLHASDLPAGGSHTPSELAKKDQALEEANRQLAEARAEIEQLKSDRKSQEKTEPVRPNRWMGGEDLEEELQKALDQLETMRAALAEAERQTQGAVERTPAGDLDGSQRERLSALALALREPVTALFHQARSLLSGPPGELSEAQRRSLEEIKTSTQRAAAMVDQLDQLIRPAAADEAENG